MALAVYGNEKLFLLIWAGWETVPLQKLKAIPSHSAAWGAVLPETV